MTWFLAELEKGENYPDSVYWPGGISAFIPLSDNVLNQPDSLPHKGLIQLYWKKYKSNSLHPLIWTNNNGGQDSSLDIQGWIKALQGESYRAEHKKPLTARLPFHYHHIPGTIRNVVAKLLINFKSYIKSTVGEFPVSWLNGGCEILLNIYNARWTSEITLPVLVLTHDIDTIYGFDWINSILKIEEKYNFRSSWNVVPLNYRINKNQLSNMLNSGHEIGMHGLWHNNKESFQSESEIRRHFFSLKLFMDEFSIKGYRSPSWYRTKALFRVLSEFFSYDLSCLDNDLICPAGKGGVGFMRPFILNAGLVELPCTLPFEAPLFFGISPERLVEYWLPKIEFIKASDGMLLINTHPDPNYLGNSRLLHSYENLLQILFDRNWLCMLPYEIVQLMNVRKNKGNNTLLNQ